MSDATSVLIVAPNWLGDAVMALPAVADVRRAYPRARLVVAARPPVAPLYAMVPGVDGAVVLQWGGALLDRGRLRDDAARLQAEHPDVAILFPNSFSSAWLTREAGVPERWGYAADLRRPLLTRAVARPRESVHQGTYYQRLVARLGIDSGPLEPAIAVSAKAVDAARAMLAGHGWNPASPLIVMAPGAAYGTAKRWLPEHFGTLITRMVSERRAQVAIVGSAADAGTSRLVIDAIAGPQRADAIDLTGATTLEALAAVMSLAMVCVTIVLVSLIYWSYRRKMLDLEERRIMIERGMTPPLRDPVGWPGVRAREQELKFQERMLRIEKGLDIPVNDEADRLKGRPEYYLRRGLVSLFVGLGVGVAYVVVRLNLDLSIDDALRPGLRLLRSFGQGTPERAGYRARSGPLTCWKTRAGGGNPFSFASAAAAS